MKQQMRFASEAPKWGRPHCRSRGSSCDDLLLQLKLMAAGLTVP
jgi:hypothetical protein